MPQICSGWRFSGCWISSRWNLMCILTQGSMRSILIFCHSAFVLTQPESIYQSVSVYFAHCLWFNKRLLFSFAWPFLTSILSIISSSQQALVIVAEGTCSTRSPALRAHFVTGNRFYNEYANYLRLYIVKKCNY